MARKTKSIQRARTLRKNDVPAEAHLWSVLRNRGLGNFKFRRQHPVGPFVVDFACVECKVIVEANGTSHLSRRKEDQERRQFLEAEGWRRTQLLEYGGLRRSRQ